MLQQLPKWGKTQKTLPEEFPSTTNLICEVANFENKYFVTEFEYITSSLLVFPILQLEDKKKLVKNE